MIKKLKGNEAAEIAEVALVLPVVVGLLLGIVWFGRAFNIWATLSHAAQQGAITAARNTCVCCPDCEVGNQPATDQHVWDSVNASLVPDAIKSDDLIFYRPTMQSCREGQDVECTSYRNVSICRFVLLNSRPDNPTAETPVCGTAVTFRYNFSLGSRSIALTGDGRREMHR